MLKYEMRCGKSPNRRRLAYSLQRPVVAPLQISWEVPNMNQRQVNQRWPDVVSRAIRRWGPAVRLAFILAVAAVIYVCVTIALRP
jgi:hypothetical protein